MTYTSQSGSVTALGSARLYEYYLQKMVDLHCKHNKNTVMKTDNFLSVCYVIDIFGSPARGVRGEYLKFKVRLA